MNQREMTRIIGTAWMAKAAVVAICTGITLAAHAENFVWRGTTDNPVWDTTSQNWAYDSDRKSVV